MGSLEGYISVYEASDGGNGNPTKTVWQFFVSGQAVSTENPRIAETMRLAIKTASKVQISYDQASKTISQARIEFSYLCESRRIQECDPASSDPKTKYICETKRYTPCKSEEMPRPDHS